MSSIFDPGADDRAAAGAAANAGVMSSGGATGPGGISAGFDFSGGNISTNFGAGQFDPLIGAGIGLAQQGVSQAGGGLPPELMALGQGTIDQLGGDINVNRLGNESDFAGLGDVFQSALSTATADPLTLGSEISDRLRALSERRNNRLVSKTFDRLKRSGKLGTTGGAGIAGELDATLQEQDLKFDLAGLEAGRGMQGDAMQRLLGASGQREAIGARQFGEEFGLQQFADNRALQQFGVGSSMFDQFLKNQFQGANIANMGTNLAAGVSQIPLAFMNSLINAGTASSNTNFAAAGVHGQNAAMAKSPFLEALNAAGSFMSGIAPGGIVGNPVGG